jgi:hypothetical protein
VTFEFTRLEPVSLAYLKRGVNSALKVLGDRNTEDEVPSRSRDPWVTKVEETAEAVDYDEPKYAQLATPSCGRLFFPVLPEFLTARPRISLLSMGKKAAKATRKFAASGQLKKTIQARKKHQEIRKKTQGKQKRKDGKAQQVEGEVEARDENSSEDERPHQGRSK